MNQPGHDAGALIEKIGVEAVAPQLRDSHRQIAALGLGIGEHRAGVRDLLAELYPSQRSQEGTPHYSGVLRWHRSHLRPGCLYVYGILLLTFQF